MRDRKLTLLCAAALIVGTVVIYWPALHGGFLWDDDVHISENATLRSLHGFWEIWFKPGATCQYYPLSFTAFWLGYQFWGLNTFGYHLMTVILHGVAAILLWRVLARLRVPGALLAGAIFAFHPVNVMSVAWMTELKNTLSGSLVLGTILAYLRFANLDGDSARSTSKSAARRCYIVALILFALAMFAKTATSFLPVTLLLIVWWQRARLNRRDWLPLVPLLAIALLLGALTIYVEQHSGGAFGKVFHLDLRERVLVSGRSFWFYLGKLIFPYPLTFIYPRWQIDPTAPWQYLFPLATAALLATLFLFRRSLGKAPAVAVTHFFVSTSMLVLFFVLYMTRYTFVSDHWQYFGAMSMIALAAAGIATIFNRARGGVRILAAAVIATMLSILATLSWRQCAIYSDVETLWRKTVTQNPNSWFVNNNLGVVLLQQGQVDEGFSYITRGLEINPNVVETQSSFAAVLQRMGRIDEALVHFRKAVDIDPADAETHGTLGAAILEGGNAEEASVHLRKALEIDPSYVEAHNNLGSALLQLGRVEEAIAHLRKALENNPQFGTAYYNLATALLRLGRANEALAHLRAVLEIEPNDHEAENKVAWILATCSDAQIRDGAKAIKLAERANASTDHPNPVFLATLAAAYAESGRFADATKTAEVALQLASAAENKPLVDDIRTQLALYQSGRAMREQTR